MHGRCIMIGRGGAILTHDLTGGIHIRLVAPVDWRLNNLISRFGWSSAQAKEKLHEEEDVRRNFFQKYLGQDAGNPEHYDLILNVARLNREEQVAAVAALFSQRQNR
jgi:cytidylate kinase